MNCLKFQNNGNKFVARLVEDGDSYGKDNKIVHNSSEPLIEFFDLRYPHVKINKDLSGQFISRYNLDTFNAVKTGIYLDSGSLDWSLNLDSVSLVKNWVKEILSEKNIVSDTHENINIDNATSKRRKP